MAKLLGKAARDAAGQDGRATAMNTLSLWQWVMAAIVLFGLVVPALLAVWMIWLRPAGRASARSERIDEPARPVGIALRDGA